MDKHQAYMKQTLCLLFLFFLLLVKLILTFNTTKEYNCESVHKNWIGKVFNVILGFDEDFKIPKSNDGKMHRFSWKLLSNAFMINERRTENASTILSPTEHTQETAFYSSLLKILYNTDLSEYDAEEGTKLRKIKKAAVQKYIASKQKEVKIQLEQLLKEKQDKGLSDNKIEILMAELVEKIDSLNEAISKINQENDTLNNKLIVLQEQERQLNITIKEFKELESNYASDISRLAFIADGKKHLSLHKANSRCPFCDVEVKIVRVDEQFIRSAKAELAGTIAKLSELVEQINIATDELKDIKEEIARIIDTIDANNKKYKEELLPLQNSYMDKIRQYQSYLNLQERIEALQSMNDSLDKDFIKNGPDTVDKVDYKTKELFDKAFNTIMADNYKAILRAMNFTPLNKVKFDMSKFDIIVNNNPKVNRSKGYSSIFNYAVVFALRKYINNQAFINPGFYFIDSPLHGLFTEFDNENLKNDLRKGFLRYVFENLAEDQIILIENTNQHELPSIESNNDIKVYIFTGDESGRYGFLEGVMQN